MADERHKGSGESEAGREKEWAVEAPRSSLTENLDDSTLMLRLGAAVNVMRSAQRWFLAVKDASGPAGSRDRIGAFMVAAAYLQEALHRLLEPFYGRVLELARQGGASKELLTRLGAINSRRKGTLYARVLLHTRNKLVFHWQEEPFKQWASEYDKMTVTWVRGIGQTSGEAVQWAASDSIVASIIPGASADELARRLQEVVTATGTVIEVFELAIGAYLKQHGAKIVEDSQ